MAPLAVARMALSSTAALQGGSTVTEYRLSGKEPGRLTPQRAQAMDLLIDQQATIRELAEIAEVSDGVLRGMVNAGLLEPVAVDADRPYPRRSAPCRAGPDARPGRSRRAAGGGGGVRGALPRSCSMA
jgi:primosomal protein N' (replication factor Y)